MSDLPDEGRKRMRTAYVDWTCPVVGCRIPGRFDNSACLEGVGAHSVMQCQRCGTKQSVTMTETGVRYGDPEGENEEQNG